MRIPFSRPLNVGGKRENIPKKIVCPAAEAPSMATLNTLSSSVADSVGVNWKENFFHALETPFTEADANTVPWVDLRETVTVPENVSDLA